MAADQPPVLVTAPGAQGGEMARRVREHDWASTPLGPMAAWPQSLRTAVDIMLAFPGPASVVWGPARVQLYNDAYVPLAGGRHPAALGRPVAETWGEARGHFPGPVLDRVFAGEAVTADEHAVTLRGPGGGAGERHFTGSFLPVRDEAGAVGGVFHPLAEVTGTVRTDAGPQGRDQRLWRVLDGMDEAFRLLGPDFTILEQNGEAQRLDGRHRGEVVGRPYWEAYPGSEGSELGRLLKRAMAARLPVSLEHRHVLPDGRARWLEMRASPAADGGLAVFWRDVTDRREAREALRESEARFRLMADAVPQIVWITDAEGRVEFFNRQWSDYTGEPFWQATAADVAAAHVHPEDGAATMAAFEAARRAGTTFRVEHRIRSATGGYRWFLVRGEPYRDPATGEVVRWFGASVDIHDRKLAEAGHRRQAEELRAIYDAAPVGLCVLDRDLRYVRVNDRLAEINGVPAEAHIGRTVAEVVPGLGDQVIGLLGRVLAGEALHGVEVTGTTPAKPGVERAWRENWVPLREPGGAVAGIAISAEEVTEEKAAAEALRASEARLRALNADLEREVAQRTRERGLVWQHSLDLLSVIDMATGTFDACNPAWTAALGWGAAEVEGRPYADFVHPDDAGASAEAFARVRAGNPVLHFENRYRTRNGGWRWLSWVAVPEGGKLYSVTRDVTDEKERQAALEAAQEALRQSQKMEAMGQLTGGVAHDFNNLLTPIMGALDLLQRRGVGGGREHRLIDGALQSAERAKALVQRLLAFARRQPLQPVAVDVGGLVAGMAGLVASTSGPQVQVVVEVPPGLPPAKADPNQLEMALLNLGVNARDAMPDGGTLRITAGEERVGPGHAAKLHPGRYVRLSVADTGVGMDEATLARAVEPFFSTKGVGKGTGLGLSMAHGLASQLGGALTIRSRPGSGTTVELWLPATDTPAAAAGAAAEPSPGLPGSGTALLVDDEDLVRESTADMLGDLGYAVVEAGSAEAALAMVRDGLRPDLLVTDHLMPGMTGTDLARAVRSGLPGTRVLVVSGYAEAEGVAPDLPRLAKPFRKDELAASLARLAGTA